MKKLITFILCVTVSYAVAQAQPGIRLHGYATYAFDDRVDSYYSDEAYFDGTLKGGFEYGGGLEFMLHEAYGFEILYLRMDSKAPMEYWNAGVQHTTFNVASNYIMAGGNRYLNTATKLEPYGGLLIGMTVFGVENPDNGNYGTATKFAWGIRLGTNIWASERVGLKIQAGLLSAVQAIGGGVFFGTGGAGAGISALTTFYQFNIGGGLVFNIRGE